MSSTNADFGPRLRELIGIGSLVINVVVFTLVGALVLDDPIYGGIAGLFGGVGTYLFLPWFLGFAQQEGGDDETPVSEALEQVDRSHRGAMLGLGMELGAILMLVLGFPPMEAHWLLGTFGALLAAVIVFFAGTVAINRATAEPA